VRAVLAGRLDIGLCARPLTDEERDQGAVATRYARTPFVFGVNGSVERTGITMAGVAAIYWGKRDRWEDGSRIRPVLRPRGDSDIPLLKRISPEMDAAVESALRRDGMLVAMTDQDAADAIEKVPGAFGGITLSLIVSEGRKIGALALDGVEPGVETLKDGSYPLSKTFFLVTRNPPASAVRRFIDFVRSPAAAAILTKNGQMVSQ
jgi:phosphate transport system substrate-binding protein